MSDTPRTDAEKIAAGFQAVPENFLRFARKLERENAELKAYADKLADGLPCLPKDVENLRTANAEFAAENAALRAEVINARQTIENHECALRSMDNVNASLRKRIEILSKENDKQTDEYVCVDREHGLWKRAAIDAARKEIK